MGGLTGRGGGVPDSPNVVNVPINDNRNFAGPGMSSVNMAKKKGPNALQQGIAAGVADAGNAYDADRRAIASSSRPVDINVPPTQISPDLLPNADYLTRARRRYNPNDDLFFGG